MKSLLKLLCVYLYCAYAFAGKEAIRVGWAFDDFREKKSKSKELLLRGVDLNAPEAIECFKTNSAFLGKRTCIKLDQCNIGIGFLNGFLGKHYKALHLKENFMDPGTFYVCLDLLEKKVFSELRVELVNYRMGADEVTFLNRMLSRNEPLKTLHLNGDCCTPDDFKMIIRSLIGNTQLTTFDVENKNLDDDCLNALAELLKDKRRPKIKHLSFCGGNLRESLAKFAVVLPSTLESLSFGYESADAAGIEIFVREVAKKQLDFFPWGSNFLELSMAYQLEQLMPSEESLEVAPLANAEVSDVSEREKSKAGDLEPAHKKMRVAGVGEATDNDSAVYDFYYKNVRTGEHNAILKKLEDLGKRGEQIGKLSLINSNIREDFIKKLLVLPVLRTVKELWLNGNPIGNNGAKRITRWLKGNNTVEELHLRGYGPGRFCTGKDGARCILEAIRENGAPNLKFIDMRGNDFLGSETCMWDESSGISRCEFAKKQLEALGVAELDEAMDEGEENPEDKALANIDDAYKNPVMPPEDEESLFFRFPEPQRGFYESESDERRLYLSPFCQWEDEGEPFSYYLPYDFPLL